MSVALRTALLGTLVGLVVFCGAWALARADRMPVPVVHDEFAYLLAGDTFAHGRLTNPTHPHWVHFDTFHVLQRPTYQAKYPPGQGASLAFGQALGGHPAFGVWAVLAAAAAACVWCLAALVGSALACGVTLAFVFHAPVFQAWGMSYWGGGLAMLAGALTCGGLERLVRKRPSPIGGPALGVGLFLLANTRPFEGGLAVVLGLAVLFGFPPPAVSRRLLARRLFPVLCIAIPATLAWVLVYNHAVTGDALRLPYLEWSAQGSPHAELHAYAGSSELPLFAKLDRLRGFFFGAILTCVVPLVLLRWRLWRVRRAVFVLTGLLIVCVASSKGWPHYLAPVAILSLLISAEALAALGTLAGERRLGSVRLGSLLVALVLFAHLGRAAVQTLGRVQGTPERSWALERQALLERLEADGERHLVLVSYPPSRSLHAEWVYNEADIDAAPVVWARDLGEEANAALLRSFANRRVWQLQPSVEGARLRPGSPSGE